MDALIRGINDVHSALAQAFGDDVTGALALHLPRIVVVGAQSSGKTSVLEALIGKGDLLPRGRDIVTRCPIVIQLTRVNDAAGEGETDDSGGRADIREYAVFGHRPDVKYGDFGAARAELQREMDRLAGPGKAVAAQPVHVRIFSPAVVDLTLVDLPGLTKIAVGDQPADIEHILRQISLQYVEPAEALILAITPANIDLVNSDALKLAKAVDPDGQRTVGVLTKLDLMDEGTHCADILAGRGPIPLRLGYCGVVGRSQQDTVQGRTLAESLRQEDAFFRYACNHC